MPLLQVPVVQGRGSAGAAGRTAGLREGRALNSRSQATAPTASLVSVLPTKRRNIIILLGLVTVVHRGQLSTLTSCLANKSVAIITVAGGEDAAGAEAPGTP